MIFISGIVRPMDWLSRTKLDIFKLRIRIPNYLRVSGSPIRANNHWRLIGALSHFNFERLLGKPRILVARDALPRTICLFSEYDYRWVLVVVIDTVVNHD